MVRGTLLLATVLVTACGTPAPTTNQPSTAVGAPTASPSSGSSLPATTGPTTAASPTTTAASPTAVPTASAPVSPTIALIATLTERLKADPTDPAINRDLGIALLQRIRETADPSLYAPAKAALETALQDSPDDALVLVGIGGLQLAQHAFAEALATSAKALTSLPDFGPALAVRVDSLVELGRYDEAAKAAQELIDQRTDLPALARVSYLRELYGDLPGALEAMQQAAATTSLAPENVAFATTIAANLMRYLGRPDEARQGYLDALALDPSYAPAEAGLGRLAVGAGDTAAAVKHFKRAAAIVPLPEYVIALGEVHEASGDQAAARQQYDLARVESRLLQAAGVVVDLELALFESDHGDKAEGLRLARRAYAERKTIKTADALAWAFYRLGRVGETASLAREARRLGTLDPVLLFHAGMIESAAGRTAGARRDLGRALALDPGFSATSAAEAKRELERLGPA